MCTPDSHNNRVEQFDPSGAYLSQFGTAGTGDGQFEGTEWVAVDQATHRVYVVDFAPTAAWTCSADRCRLRWGGAAVVERTDRRRTRHHGRKDGKGGEHDDEEWAGCGLRDDRRGGGRASEALEYVERARGHLYAFHQLIGRADALFEESARRLAADGHPADAASLWRNVVGRDVLEGRWTFQIVEGFDDDYYSVVRSEVDGLEKRLVDGRRHAHEEIMRYHRRTDRPPFLVDVPA